MSTENTEATEQDGLLGGLGIFGATAESISATVEEDVYEGGGYTPHLELDPQSNKGEDTAIVRLIPSLIKGNKNIASKISYKVTSDDGKKFMFDSMKSFGWRENDCIVADTHASVKGDDTKLARFKKVFNYKRPSTVLVQVLKYATKPELEGKIMPLRIYEDVQKLIQKTITPSKEDIELNDVQPHNCFDLLTGKALMLKATLKVIGKEADGVTDKVGRSFENSSFVKAEQYKHFKLPQRDEDGEFVTATLPDGETVVNVYDKISLSEDEVAAYNKQEFATNPALVTKLKSVLTYLSEEDTPALEDYGYREPTDERLAWTKTLTQAILNGTPATLGGEIVGEESNNDSVASGDSATTTGDDAADAVETQTDDADLEDILAQAKAEE